AGAGPVVRTPIRERRRESRRERRRGERKASGVAHPALATTVSVVRTYADLTKPRLLPMVLFTAIPILGMAAGGWPSLAFSLLVLLGVGLAAASANTLNAWIE